VQGTGSLQPTYTPSSINGLPTINGDDSDDVMSGNFAYACNDEFHIFTVASKLESPTDDVIYDLVGANCRISQYTGATYRKVDSNDDENSGLTQLTSASSVLLYTSYKNSNEEFDVYVDGSVASATDYPDTHVLDAFTTQQFSTYYILDDSTGGNAWGGGLGEYIITRGSLSTSDRQKIEGYLAHKWGLEGNLPSGHPYKTQKPTV